MQVAAASARQRLLTAALEVYAQHGSRGATSRRIAAAAEVNEVTLFRHFGSKELLLTAAIQLLGEHRARARLPVESRAPRVELVRWARVQLDHLRTHGAAIRTCIGELEERPDFAAHLAAGSLRAVEEVWRYLRAMQAAGFIAAGRELKPQGAAFVRALAADAIGRPAAPGLFPAAGEIPGRYVDDLLAAVGLPAETQAIAQRAPPPPFEPDATGA